MLPFIPATPSLLAFQLGANQLNTFESFLTNAVTGIQSAGVISGMLKVSYTILLVGFLWELYQSAMNGGDVRGLGRNAVKYIATALIVQAWPAVFTSVNHAFVSAGSWMTGQGGVGNVLDTWMAGLKTEFQNDGVIHTWNVITGDIAGLLDAAIVIVAYMVYPIVSIIFGFFYMLMGSILFVTGPIVIALLPLGATNRIAKTFIENVFIWNAWPLLYGALGLLITATHIGDMAATLGNQSFLGALNGLEGSILVGIMSLVYSLAIAVIPFMAKAIVQGEAGAVVGQMLSAATTAVSAGVGAAAGVGAGLAAAKGGGAGAGNSSSSNAAGQQGAGQQAGQGAVGNRPAVQQPNPAAAAGASGGQNSPPVQTAGSSSNGALPSASASSSGVGEGSKQSAAASTNSNTTKTPAGGGTTSAGATGSVVQGAPASPAEKAAQGNLAGAAQEQAILQGMESPDGPGHEPPGPDINANQSAGSLPAGSPASGSPSSAETAASTSAFDSSGTGSNKLGTSAAQGSGSGQLSNAGARSGGNSSSQSALSRGPNPRFGLSSFAAYHAARMATQSAASAGGAISQGVQAVQGAIKDPASAGAKVGAAAGTSAGKLVSGLNSAVSSAGKVGYALGDPAGTIGAAIDGVATAARGAKEGVASSAKGATQAFREAYQESSQPQSGEDGAKK